MLHKKKTREEVEAIALSNLRHRKERKMLNNTNVDCFIDGYLLAQDELLNRPSFTIDYLEDTLSGLHERLDYIEKCAGYGGRGYTDEEERERRLIFDVISHICACMKIDKKQNKTE